jgi:hypothetical protein
LIHVFSLDLMSCILYMSEILFLESQHSQDW